MATAADDDCTDAELVQTFKAFVKVAAAGKKLTPAEECMFNDKACGKLTKDCLGSYKAYINSNIVDASIFPKHKVKGKKHIDLTETNCSNFIKDCAHEICKTKQKNPKLPKDDPEVEEINREIRKHLKISKPQVKGVKQSTTGNVLGLTDHTKYTGTHKERFDESGKGRGKEGRVDIKKNEGYVGDYKGKDTYDETH